MAEALLRGVLRTGLMSAGDVAVFDVLPERREVFVALGCATSENADAALSRDVVLLATKPQHVREALAGAALRPEQLLVSILAGVPTARLEAMLPPGTRVVRVMPNTPLLVGHGMSALAGGSNATPDDVALTLELFAAGGDAVEAAEKDLDAVTALSGSGPAYVFYFVEALLKGAADIGLAPDLARRLALGTLRGSAAMLDAGGDEADLRRRVTSPGGTTAAALAVLENGDLSGLVRRALAAARDRGVELGRDDG